MRPPAASYMPTTDLVIIVGSYGSGKTEIAVNLAVHLAKRGRRVQIADLDIVNPYFRSREARATMERVGVRVVGPTGEAQFAELPIILPEIKGMLAPIDGVVSIFDVGGEDVGARVLSSFVEALGQAPYTLLQVLNTSRPLNETAERCVQAKAAIEKSSRLAVTGFISNTHLIEHTTAEVITDGHRLSCQVSALTETPIAFLSAMGPLADEPTVRGLDVPIVRLERIMLPPWLVHRRGQAGDRHHNPTNDKS